MVFTWLLGINLTCSYLENDHAERQDPWVSCLVTMVTVSRAQKIEFHLSSGHPLHQLPLNLLHGFLSLMLSCESNLPAFTSLV